MCVRVEYECMYVSVCVVCVHVHVGVWVCHVVCVSVVYHYLKEIEWSHA